jgi:hypothetical protein
VFVWHHAEMREHRYSFEMPHSAARIWALFQDYDRWTDYAPMVIRVEVIYPGDEHHNGRLRRVIFKMPFGREGAALELVTDVEPERGYTYTMISAKPGNDQIGHVRLEPLAANRTRFEFDERYNLTSWPYRWFEAPIYRFINKNNEDSMRRASESGSASILSTDPSSSTPDRLIAMWVSTQGRRRLFGYPGSVLVALTRVEGSSVASSGRSECLERRGRSQFLKRPILSA